MQIDLHTHTHCSDGELSPASLVDRAIAMDIRILSITDHDTCAAYTFIENPRLTLVPGIELSTHWKGTGIHIVGLDIDLHSSEIAEATGFQQSARETRARSIAVKLAKKGIENAYEGAEKIAANKNIGRPHFAQYLVNIGKSKSIQDAFRKFLGAGKAGDIKHYWAPMPQIIDWIRGAGGIPVLAHPLMYKLTRTKLSALVDDFIKSGGQAIEVVSGKQLPGETQALATLCNEKELLASCGSDFHRPDQNWAELGQFPRLPVECKPVWDHFR